VAGDQGEGRGVRETSSHPAPKPVARRAFFRTPYGATFSRKREKGFPPSPARGRRLGWGQVLPRLPLLLVAAVARNGVIGSAGGLAWRLASDLKRFKALTMGKPLVMGRKTYQSIGRLLPGRETIVVTRDRSFSPEGALVAHSLEAALALAAERAAAMGADAIVIAGGGQLYAQTIGRASRLAITEVALEPAGDTRFPPIDPEVWREVKRERGVRGPRDEADFAFVEYTKSTHG